jgi:4-oxalmesaconate hydratase
MIIDCHGHYTTAPGALEAWRELQVASLKDPAKAPPKSALRISDDEIRESLEGAQLRIQRERGTDRVFAAAWARCKLRATGCKRHRLR